MGSLENEVTWEFLVDSCVREVGSRMESLLLRALESTLRHWLKTFSRDQFKLRGRSVQLSDLGMWIIVLAMLNFKLGSHIVKIHNSCLPICSWRMHIIFSTLWFLSMSNIRESSSWDFELSWSVDGLLGECNVMCLKLSEVEEGLNRCLWEFLKISF